MWAEGEGKGYLNGRCLVFRGRREATVYMYIVLHVYMLFVLTNSMHAWCLVYSLENQQLL